MKYVKLLFLSLVLLQCVVSGCKKEKVDPKTYVTISPKGENTITVSNGETIYVSVGDGYYRYTLDVVSSTPFSIEIWKNNQIGAEMGSYEYYSGKMYNRIYNAALTVDSSVEEIRFKGGDFDGWKLYVRKK